MVEELLSHGSTVGYTEDLVDLSASVIQLSYRIYRYINSAKAKLSDATMLNAQLEGANMMFIEEIVRVKESRDNLLEQVRWRRKLQRLPIVEVYRPGDSESSARRLTDHLVLTGSVRW